MASSKAWGVESRLVTPDEIKDVGQLGMWLDVNGERVQNGSTATMIFNVPKIVSYASHFMILEPGDVFTTGTPPDPLEFSDIKALFPLDNGAAIEATDEIAEKVAQYKRIKADIKTYTEAAEALQFEIAEFIRPNARLTVGGKDVLTWKAQNWTGLDEGALRQAHPALFAEFCKTKVIRVMRVKKG